MISFDVGRHAEGHPHTRWDEGLIVGGIDLVQCVALGVDPSRHFGELGARFVNGCLALVFEIAFLVRRARRLGPGFAGHGPVYRGEFANEVSIADAHVDDVFFGTAGWSEKVVAHGGFEDLAHMHGVIYERYVIDPRCTKGG